MLSLEQALSEWPEWRLHLDHRPTVVRKIKTGLTNQIYVIRCGERKLIIRINNPRSAHLGICRKREKAIVKKLSTLKISPNILYSDPRSRYSVMEYEKGRTWSENDFSNPAQKQKLKTLIQTYQSVEFPNKVLLKRDYHAYFQHYQNEISRARLSVFRKNQKQFQGFKRWLITSKTLQLPLALTHHDITPRNIIETEQGLKIVDWEYAAIGWPQLDYIFLGKNPNYRKNSAKRFIFDAHTWAEKIWWLIRN